MKRGQRRRLRCRRRRRISRATALRRKRGFREKRASWRRKSSGEYCSRPEQGDEKLNGKAGETIRANGRAGARYDGQRCFCCVATYCVAPCAGSGFARASLSRSALPIGTAAVRKSAIGTAGQKRQVAGTTSATCP